MTRNSLKSFAAIGALALVLAFLPGGAQAQTIQSSITTSSAITATDGVDMGFGTWFLIHGGAPANDFTLTMDTAGAVVSTAAPPSVSTELVAGSGQGTVLVTVPAGANGVVLQMTRGAIVDFPSAALTLQNTTYGTVTQGANQPLAGAAVPVTVVTGGVNEVVSFGAQIAVTGTPADGANTGSFSVTFAY